MCLSFPPPALLDPTGKRGPLPVCASWDVNGRVWIDWGQCGGSVGSLSGNSIHPTWDTPAPPRQRGFIHSSVVLLQHPLVRSDPKRRPTHTARSRHRQSCRYFRLHVWWCGGSATGPGACGLWQDMRGSLLLFDPTPAAAASWCWGERATTSRVGGIADFRCSMLSVSDASPCASDNAPDSSKQQNRHARIVVVVAPPDRSQLKGSAVRRQTTQLTTRSTCHSSPTHTLHTRIGGWRV